MRTYIGIDPGMSGGIAVVSVGKGTQYNAYPMPNTDEGIYQLLFKMPTSPSPVIYMERLWGFTGNLQQVGARVFKLGYSCGLLKGIVRSLFGYYPKEVTPQEWMKHLGVEPRRSHHERVAPIKWPAPGGGTQLMKKGRSKKVWDETQAQFKSRLKTMAVEMFPQVSGITLKTCDALLIAEYARSLGK